MVNKSSCLPFYIVLTACLVTALCAGCQTVTLPPMTSSHDSTVVSGIQISRSLHMRFGPHQDLLNKKIYVEFYESPKVSKILQNNLKARGFNVVESPDEADKKLFLSAFYTITKACKKPISGTLGKVLESSVEYSPSMSSGHMVTTGPGSVIATSAISGLTSAISIATFTDALLKMTGFNDWLGKKISGDKSCDDPTLTYTSDVKVLVTEGGLFHRYQEGEVTWEINASASAIELPLGVVAPEAVEYAMQPVYDLKPMPAQLQ